MVFKKFFLVLVFLALFGSTGSAQIFIEQGKIELSVSPGQRVSDSVTVHNTSNAEVRVKVYWEDFEYQPPYDGTKKFYPAGTSRNSFRNWAQFSPGEFVLPPFGKTEINYIFDVPSDAQGGYYGVLFFEKLDQKMVDSKTGLNIVTRVGCLFFLESEDKIKRASADNFAFSGNKLQMDLTNEGNTVIIPKGIYYIMDEQGNVYDRAEVPSYYMPPQASAIASVSIGGDFPAGEYTMVLTFDMQEGDSLVKEVDFEKAGSEDFRLIAVRD